MKGVGTFLVKIELDQSAKKTKKMGVGGGERGSLGTRLGVARVHLTPAHGSSVLFSSRFSSLINSQQILPKEQIFRDSRS